MVKLTIRGQGRPRARLGAIAAVVVAFAAAPVAATAAVYTVSGTQLAISETESTMTGGLSGNWTATVADFRYDEATGRLVAWGTETFSGCLDRLRNGCDASDPSGTMSFKFIAWQKYDPQNGYAFVTGACIHPVTAGTAGFKDSHGVIAMKDTPHADGSVTTNYVGVLTIPSGPSIKSTAGGGNRSLQASTPRVTCGG
jgi:hypothetical protein